MSSYILGEGWPIKPSWTNLYMKRSTYQKDYTSKGYRKESTYRHDYNKGKAPEYDKYGLSKHVDYSRPKFDDAVWQRGRNESSEQYEERLREMAAQNEPDYYRTYEERISEEVVLLNHKKGNYMSDKRHEHDPYRDGPLSERRAYDDMDRRDYRDGPLTERDYNRSVLDRGNLTYRRYDKRDDPRTNNNDLYKYKEVVNNRAMADHVIVDEQYDRYRPTQKDYGDFETTPKLDNMPKPYRGQFDRQLDAFQKRQREQNLAYDTSVHPIPPAHIDYKSAGNIESLSKPESGVYLFIRTHQDALIDVRKSFQRHKTTLSQSGHLTGIALPDQIKVTGDYNNWQLRRGPWMEDRRQNITEYHTDYIMIVLWFPSAKAAQRWIDYDQDFKIASFPAPYGVDMIIVPINYIPPEDAACRTFLLTEYPEVKQPDYFRTQIIEPMREVLRDYQCEPFVVRTNGVAPVRGSWINHRSTIAVHRFSTDDEAQRFYHDRRAGNLRGKLNGVTRGGRHTTVRFTITETI